MLSLLLSALNTMQPGRAALHEARSCRRISLEVVTKDVYSPVRHLIQCHGTSAMHPRMYVGRGNDLLWIMAAR
jgi:hypothetical protein